MNDVEKYIAKQPSPQKEILKKLRQIIFSTLPKDIDEKMKWGVPAFANGLFYLVGLKDHVNIGFSIKGLSKSEVALFDGGGATTKHVEVFTPKEIDEKRISTLLNLVYEKNQ